MRVRPATDPQQRWRRTNSAGRLRNDAQRGALRALWLHRDALARERDVAWHQVVRDQVMVEMAKNCLRPCPIGGSGQGAESGGPGCLPVAGRHRRGRLSAIASLERADGPPARSLRAWEQRDPQAAARWTALRAALTERAEELHVWMQTLLAPDIVADLAWSPAEDPGSRLAELGARPWRSSTPRTCSRPEAAGRMTDLLGALRWVATRPSRANPLVGTPPDSPPELSFFWAGRCLQPQRLRTGNVTHGLRRAPLSGGPPLTPIPTGE